MLSISHPSFIRFCLSLNAALLCFAVSKVSSLGLGTDLLSPRCSLDCLLKYTLFKYTPTQARGLPLLSLCSSQDFFCIHYYINILGSFSSPLLLTNCFETICIVNSAIQLNWTKKYTVNIQFSTDWIKWSQHLWDGTFSSVCFCLIKDHIECLFFCFHKGPFL